jgi:hypothetical protein
MFANAGETVQVQVFGSSETAFPVRTEVGFSGYLVDVP